MLNLVGVDLVVDSPDYEATIFIESYIRQYVRHYWSRPAWPGSNDSGLTFPWPRSEAAFQLNRLVWPVGASRWAYGFFLASSDQVKELINQSYLDNGEYNKISLLIGTPDIGPQVGQQGSTDNQIEIMVYLLPPTPLSGIRGLTGNIQSLYLITLVDQRFFWWQNSTGLIDVTEGTTTWDDLYTMASGRVGLTSEEFTWDMVDSNYLNPSQAMFASTDQPVPMYLDAIAFNVGQRIVAYFDGKVAAKNTDESLQMLNTDFSNNPDTRIIMAGGQRFPDPL